jgi:hypothetical protein
MFSWYEPGEMMLTSHANVYIWYFIRAKFRVTSSMLLSRVKVQQTLEQIKECTIPKLSRNSWWHAVETIIWLWILISSFEKKTFCHIKEKAIVSVRHFIPILYQLASVYPPNGDQREIIIFKVPFKHVSTSLFYWKNVQ